MKLPILSILSFHFPIVKSLHLHASEFFWALGITWLASGNQNSFVKPYRAGCPQTHGIICIHKLMSLLKSNAVTRGGTLTIIIFYGISLSFLISNTFYLSGGGLKKRKSTWYIIYEIIYFNCDEKNKIHSKLPCSLNKQFNYINSHRQHLKMWEHTHSEAPLQEGTLLAERRHFHAYLPKVRGASVATPLVFTSLTAYIDVETLCRNIFLVKMN